MDTMRVAIALIFVGIIFVAMTFVDRLSSTRKIEGLESQIDAQYQKIEALSYNSENNTEKTGELVLADSIEEADPNPSNAGETLMGSLSIENLIEKIKEEVANLKVDKEKLETDLSKTAEEKAALETQVQQLEITAKTSEEKYRQEKNDLQTLLDNQKKNYQVLELKLDNLKKDRDKTVELKDKTENELLLANTDIKNLQEQLSTKSQSIDDLNKKVTESQKVVLDTQQKYRQEKSDLQALLDTQKKTSEELQLKLANLQKDKDSIAEVSSKTGNELAATKEQIKILQEQLSTKSQSIDDLNKKVIESQKVVLDTQATLKQAQDSKTKTDADINNLIAAKGELERDLVKAAEDGARFKIQIQQLEAATKVYEEKISQQTQDYGKEGNNLQALLDTQKKDYKVLELKLADMQLDRDSIADLKGKTESELLLAKAEIKNLEQKLSANTQTIDEFNKQLSEAKQMQDSRVIAEGDIKNLTADKKNLEIDLSRTAEEKALLENRVQQLEIATKTSQEKYRQEKSDLQVLLDTQKKTSEELQLKLANLQKDKDSIAGLSGKTGNEISVAQAKIENLQQQLNTKSQTIDELNKKLIEAQKVVLDTQATLKQAQDSKTKTNADINNLTADTADKDQLEGNLVKAAEEKAALQTQIKKLEASLKASEEKYGQDKSDWKVVLDTQKNYYQTLESKLADMQRDRDTMAELKEKTEEELVTARKEINSLQQSKLGMKPQTIEGENYNSQIDVAKLVGAETQLDPKLQQELQNLIADFIQKHSLVTIIMYILTAVYPF